MTYRTIILKPIRFRKKSNHLNLKLIISLFIFFICLSVSYGQKGIEAGGWIGPSVYFGDLNPDYDITHPGIAGGLIVKYVFNDRINLKFGANYLYVHGDDLRYDNNFQQQRGLNFRSNVWELGSELEFNFFAFKPGDREKFFTPFLSAGIGLFKFEPKATYQGMTKKLRMLGTEGQNIGEEYASTKFAGIISGGFKYALNNRWILSLTASTRILTTDYLDDVSTTYPDLLVIESLRNDPDAGLFSDPTENSYVGKQRGDSVNKDSYNYIGIGVTYFFGGLQCPDISK
ncbi:DUF6089 family protein [Membranihabitans marinus]|uniref:type IX secretion system protein PorG n=1 Tax=Membranihabitans marinus TaxID=1227546 RepID=UPI0021BD24A5|nr:DUF6089 family protein [Membranihabitans marinus]